MAFENEYWHALDNNRFEELDLSVKDIGISHGAGDVLDGLKTQVHAGAKHIELGFTGMGKGMLSQGQTTPEMFGKDKREAMRQFSKINDVSVSTHASLGIRGMSGMGEQGFSDIKRRETLNEIKRTVDFAADVAGGGPVVVHAGEFPQEMGEKYKEHFETHSGDKEEVVSLVDTESGQLVRFQKGQKQLEPIWQKNEEGLYVDENGKAIKDQNDELARAPVIGKDGFIEFREVEWKEYVKRAEDKKKDDHKNAPTAGQLFYFSMMEKQMQQAKPFAHSYQQDYKGGEEAAQQLKSKYEAYKEMEKGADKEGIQRLRNNLVMEFAGIERNRVDIPEDKLPSEFLKEKIKSYEMRTKAVKGGAIGYAQQVREIERLKKKIVPIEQFGVQKSADTLSDAAMYAYEKEKKMKLKKPLFIAPENVFPEWGYGAHPKELKELVLTSRKAMAKKLQQKGISSDKAKKVAADHIRATFDVAHANTWRKFFKGTDKEFNKWLMKEVDALNKEGIIGHVHLSDNFGYFDEHLSLGEGNVPVKEFIKKMKDSGFKGTMVAEGGAQQHMDVAMTDAWRFAAHSPMYRTSGWSDVQDSYLGRTRASDYMVGKIVPSDEFRGYEKGTPFWSGLGLE